MDAAPAAQKKEKIMNNELVTIKDAKCGKMNYEFSLSILEQSKQITFECPYCGLKTIVTKNVDGISVNYENV